jgi:hypothetical protein
VIGVVAGYEATVDVAPAAVVPTVTPQKGGATVGALPDASDRASVPLSLLHGRVKKSE